LSTWSTEENREKLKTISELELEEFNEGKSFFESLIKLSADIQKLTRLPKEKNETIIKMKRDTVEWLTEEDLYAFGYLVLPTAERMLRLIPNEFWINAKINWEDDIANDEVSKFQKNKNC